MILRAIFFVVAIALLAPRGPALGAPSISAPGANCNDGACTIDTSMLDNVKADILARLAEVKAEIAQAQAARAANG